MSTPKWIIVDNDEVGGPTYVIHWSHARKRVADAAWSSSRSDAVEFDNEDFALLVANIVGGKPQRVLNLQDLVEELQSQLNSMSDNHHDWSNRERTTCIQGMKTLANEIFRHVAMKKY